MSEEEVTADDFIMPEFRNANPKNYERRGDGKIVRKDRWETGLRNIATIVGMGRSEFEISQVVERIRQLASHELAAWQEIDYNNPATLPIEGRLCLVDWDCDDHASIKFPEILIWIQKKDSSEPQDDDREGFMWASADSQWAGFGLDLPDPTHFKYVGFRPRKVESH